MGVLKRIGNFLKDIIVCGRCGAKRRNRKGTWTFPYYFKLGWQQKYKVVFIIRAKLKQFEPCLHKSSFSLEADEELTLAVVSLSSKVRYLTQELLKENDRIHASNGKFFFQNPWTSHMYQGYDKLSYPCMYIIMYQVTITTQIETYQHHKSDKIETIHKETITS